MIHVTIMRANGQTEEALAPQPEEHKNVLDKFDGLTVDKAMTKISKNVKNPALVRLELALSEVAARVERRQRQPDSELARHDLASLTVKVQED
jgi:hypothetical protein